MGNKSKRAKGAKNNGSAGAGTIGGQTPPKTPVAERIPLVAAIELPIADPPPKAYMQQHVEAQLTGHQAIGLRALYDGLRRGDAILASGRNVVSVPDALRYVLEQIANVVATSRTTEPTPDP